MLIRWTVTVYVAQVWIVYGDGSLGYTVAEFDTFTRHKVSLCPSQSCKCLYAPWHWLKQSPVYSVRLQLSLWSGTMRAGVKYPESRSPSWAATWPVALHLQVGLMSNLVYFWQLQIEKCIDRWVDIYSLDPKLGKTALRYKNTFIYLLNSSCKTLKWLKSRNEVLSGSHYGSEVAHSASLHLVIVVKCN